MSALITFLGGSAFRMIWGEFSTYFKNRQDAKNELALMKVQGELDAAQHARNMEAIRVQAELGVKTIQVQAEADADRSAGEAFKEAMARAAVPTGIAWVDAWNGCIRPAFATVALILWVLAVNETGWKMSEWDAEMIGVVAGFYFADRYMRKRGR